MPVKNFLTIKSGQRLYRVWGMPLNPAYINPGDPEFRIYVEACRPIGKRYFNFYGSCHWIAGSVQNRYFRKKERAEQFMREIYQGLHPKAFEEMTKHSVECKAFMDSFKERHSYGGVTVS